MTQHDAAMDALDALDARTMPGNWYLVPPSETEVPQLARSKQGYWRAIKRKPLAQQDK